MHNNGQARSFRKKRKLISVCIPTYDMHGRGRDFLQRSLDRLTQQTWKDFDVVISDYSTSSAIRDLCKNYEDTLDIQYFQNTDSTGGMSANTNNAIRHAKGKLIKILFQDDFLRDEKSLGVIANNFDLEKDDWLATGCEHSRDGIAFFNPHYPEFNRRIHLGKNTIGSPSVLTIKNDDPLLFDVHLKWLTDCDYYKRCFQAFGKPKIVDTVTVVIGVGDHQITNTEATVMVRKNELRYVKEKFRNRARTVLNLSNVTLVAVSSVKIPQTLRALQYSMSGIDFGNVLLISHQRPKNLPVTIQFKECSPMNSSDDYSKFMAFELAKYIETDFALIVQHDGFVVRPNKWSDGFFRYDYIGAPWPGASHYTESGENIRVGNGGFSLRSKKLLSALNELRLPFTDQGTGYFHEDGILCVYYRKQLEAIGIKFAPVEVASLFSREIHCSDSIPDPFGFHRNRRVMQRFFIIKHYVRHFRWIL